MSMVSTECLAQSKTVHLWWFFSPMDQNIYTSVSLFLSILIFKEHMFRMHKLYISVIQLSNLYGGLWATIFLSICEETVPVQKNKILLKKSKLTSLFNL